MSRHRELYDNLMQLVKTNEAFYYVDHVLNDIIYRVFTYRLASYTDFLEPDALECRGHMFRVDGDGVELVSLPLEKFFNLHEVSTCLNTLGETLVKQGRLSPDVFERAKRRNKG